MKIKKIKCGSDNCYLVIKNKEALLVDTCRKKDREKVLAICKAYDVKVIVLSHGHQDHVASAGFFSDYFKAPIAMNSKDFELAKNPEAQVMTPRHLGARFLSYVLKKISRPPSVEAFEIGIDLYHGYRFDDWGFECQVVGLPGHTQGSIGLLVGQDDLIVGDALMHVFKAGLPLIYGDRDQMLESAKKISSMDLKGIHFGHGRGQTNKNWLGS